MPPTWASHAISEVVISPKALHERVKELGNLITEDYRGRPPLLIGVLKGASSFMTDLSQSIHLTVEIDYMAVASYGTATKSSGIVRIVKDLDLDLTDRHVLVVEDIVDSGLTLSYLNRYLKTRKPASVEVCALLVKEGQQRAKLDLKYIGFTIPEGFVVGYGLDINEKFQKFEV